MVAERADVEAAAGEVREGVLVVRVGLGAEVAEVELPGGEVPAVAVVERDADLKRLQAVDVGLHEGVALLHGEGVVVLAGVVDDAWVVHGDGDVLGVPGDVAEVR